MNTSDAQIKIDQLIDGIRSKLPIQNPLHTFVHNNVMQMFESKEFHEAMADVGRLYHGRPYWPLYRYKECYREGGISSEDIFQGIEHYLSHHEKPPVLDRLNLTTKDFFYKLMFSELNFNDDEIQPEITNQSLWDSCQAKMVDKTLVLSRSNLKLRAREYWERYHNETVSLTTQPFIIRLISSFLDQGQSFWGNPFTHKGLLEFFRADVLTTKAFALGWQKHLVKKVENYSTMSAQEIIERELTSMGIPEDHWQQFLLEILFDLKGWAGMVNKLEREPWQATIKAPSIKLVEYVAMILLVESALDSYHAEAHSIDLSLIYLRKENQELRGYQLGMGLYQITMNFRLDERWFNRLSAEEIMELIDAIDTAEHLHQTRLWHEAYEQHFYREAITAISGRKKKPQEEKQKYADVFFCIDDREESIRRHLEEIDGNMKTYGVVGFFGIDMRFSSYKSQKLIAQCPPVITPSRIVREVTKDSLADANFQRINRLRGISDLSLYYNSRTLFRGVLSTLLLGVACVFPMFLQVFFPKQSKSMKKTIEGALKLDQPKTEMSIDKTAEGEGYTIFEQAKIVESILRMCGFPGPMSSLIILLGHGSSSTNNPFKQAYGCGACGGNAGIPNSRAFAKMANNPAVRAELVKLGLDVPENTFFVSGFHDTCTDEIFYLDPENIPETHLRDFNRAKQSLDRAAKYNAYERCQRFSSPEAKVSPDNALEHVIERAHDLAQPRPEYGHSKNALAIVGLRDLTKGLYLNRRSFLLTYDWKIDPDGSVLKQVILGGIPVAVNINMDYYFSSVDNDNFGCGSKLPLNLTALLGVMTGSQSDLRIGLARQMVEIHEPIRNMTVVEAPLERVEDIFENHPRLKNLLHNQWMRLVISDPEKGKWYTFKQGLYQEFIPHEAHLKQYSSSMDLFDQGGMGTNFAEIAR